MKIVSIFFLLVLLFPIAYFALHIFSLYDSKSPLKAFGVSDDLIYAMAKPYIIWLTIYLIVFIASIFLNVRKKYTPNVIFLGVMIGIYIVLPYFLNHI
ncbi:MAG: hypothetical protein JSU01_03310 [Bacteroidetes bacterium]|nr:hypothetical protein [Bacteroidota bacterium]